MASVRGGKGGKKGGDEGEGNVINLPFRLDPKKRTRAPSKPKPVQKVTVPKVDVPAPVDAAPAAPVAPAGRGGFSSFPPPEALQPRDIPFVDKADVPPHAPTAQSRSLAMVARIADIEDEELATMIGVDLDTLYAYYRDEMIAGDKRIDASIVGNLARFAQGQGQGAVTAAIFWTKARLGWRDGGEKALTAKQRAKEAQIAAANATAGSDETVFVFDIGEKGRGKTSA